MYMLISPSQPLEAGDITTSQGNLKSKEQPVQGDTFTKLKEKI